MDSLAEYKASMSKAVATASSDDLVVSNLPLVVFLAKRFSNKHPNIDICDLVSCGNLGLCKAAANFDRSLSIEFSTYASTIIEREFLKCMVDEQNRGCRLPKKTFEQVQIVAAFVNEFGKLPDIHQLEQRLSRKTALPPERYNEIINAYRSSLPYATEFSEEVAQ